MKKLDLAKILERADDLYRICSETPIVSRQVKAVAKALVEAINKANEEENDK